MWSVFFLFWLFLIAIEPMQYKNRKSKERLKLYKKKDETEKKIVIYVTEPKYVISLHFINHAQY